MLPFCITCGPSWKQMIVARTATVHRGTNDTTQKISVHPLALHKNRQQHQCPMLTMPLRTCTWWTTGTNYRVRARGDAAKAGSDHILIKGDTENSTHRQSSRGHESQEANGLMNRERGGIQLVGNFRNAAGEHLKDTQTWTIKILFLRKMETQIKFVWSQRCSKENCFLKLVIVVCCD